MDLLINVPVHDIGRTWQMRDRLARAAGSEVEGNNPGEVIRSFIETLRRNLARLGYKYDENSPAVRSANTRNRNLFQLILAARNPLALKLWRSVTRTTATGQRSLALVPGDS